MASDPIGNALARLLGKQPPKEGEAAAGAVDKGRKGQPDPEAAKDALLLNTFTPELREEPRRIEVDGLMQAAVVISDFMSDNDLGWMDALLTSRNTPLSIRLEPCDVRALRDSIDMHENQTASGMMGPRMTASKMDDLQRSAEHGQRILYMLGDQGMKFFNCVITAVVRAKDAEALDKRLRYLKSSLDNAGMAYRIEPHTQLKALMSASPAMARCEATWESAVRPFPSSTLSFSLFTQETGLDDGIGINIGHDSLGGLVRLNVTTPTETRQNSNIIILGQSGSGKSFLAKKLLLNEAVLWGSKIFVLDPEGEFVHMALAMGGDVIRLGARSSSKISPLQPRALTFTSEEDEEDSKGADIDDVDAGSQYVLQSTIPFAKTFLQLAFNLWDDDMPLLEEALETVYGWYGIEPETTFAEYESRRLNYPIMEDLYDALSQYRDLESRTIRDREAFGRLANGIRSAAVGINAPIFNTRSNISTSADIVVFSTEDMGEDKNLNSAMYYNILTYLWSSVRMTPATGKPIRIVIDEAHNFINAQNIPCAEQIRSLVKRIRKRGGGTTIISQEVGDFLNSAVYAQGCAVLNNATYRMFGGQDSESLHSVASLFNMPDELCNRIKKAEKGQFAVFAGNSDRVWCKVDAEKWETDLFGTKGGR